MTGAALTAANNAAAIIIRYIMILWFLFQICPGEAGSTPPGICRSTAVNAGVSPA